MALRPLRLDAWVVSRLRYGESWVALPLWVLAVLLLAVPKLGLILVVPALFIFFAVVAVGGTRTEKREIEVTREGLRVGNTFVPRTAIRRDKRTSPQRYAIDDAWRRVREIVVLEANAEEIERVLRLDSRMRMRRFTVGAFPLHDFRVLFVSIAIAMMSSAWMGEIPAMLAWFVSVPLVTVFLVPGSIDFGPDGIEARWLFLRRYVPAKQIVSVDLDGDVVHVELRDGAMFSLPTRFNRRVAKEIAHHASALVRRRAK